MHPLLSNLHSYNRYLLLALLLFVLYRSFRGWTGNKPYEKADNSASAALLGLTHLQALLGLVMYFATSPYTTPYFSNFGAAMKSEWPRYFAVEHILAMLIAVALIQTGRTLSKKAAIDMEKHKKVAIYTSIATLLIVGTLAMKGLLFNTLASVVGAE